MWDQKYSVNIKSIDRQHQTFFEIINEFYFGFEEADGNQEKLIEIVDKLVEYGNFHLGYEEKYFKELNYAEAEEHIKQHDAFREQIAQYRGRLNEPVKNVKNMASEIADFAKNWLSGHIMETDQKYSRFFLMNDVK
jgi:hemerythrin